MVHTFAYIVLRCALDGLQNGNVGNLNSNANANLRLISQFELFYSVEGNELKQAFFWYIFFLLFSSSKIIDQLHKYDF